MSDRLSWFPLFAADWLLDVHVQMMSLEQQGAYVRLLCLAWHNDGIPADAPAIAALLGGRADLWTAPLSDRWTPHSARADRLVNPRLEAVRAEQQARRDQQVAAAKAGASKRAAPAERTLSGRAADAEPLEQNRTEENKTQQAAVGGDPELPPVSIGYLTQCVMALNAGMAENPRLAGQFREIPASTQVGTVTWEGEGIPLATAVAVIRRVASQYKPTPRSRQPSSLKYFDGAIREALFGKKRTEGPRQPDRWVDPHKGLRPGALNVTLQDVLPTVVGRIQGAA